MTTIQLYNKHKAGEISREKFLYEVRRDNNLPFITNLTSYDDAVKILKNKGIVTEVDTKEAKADEAVKAEVKAKAPSTKKPESLSIDVANPYEYRHGLQHELEQMDDYSNETLEKAKTIVLKNLAKDANFYSTLLNQKQSHYEFKTPETDAPGMQAKADGYLKKELKKDEKANVKDSLNKSEAAKGKPKGVKEMPDKGVEGKEKVVKEGIDDKVEDMIKSGKIKPEDVKTAAEKAMKGDTTSLVALMAGIKLAEDKVEEAKENKYIDTDEDGDQMLNQAAISSYLKSVINPEELESVDNFINDEEGYGESSMYFFDNDEDPATTTEKDVEDWAKQEMSYYLFSKPDEFPVKESVEEGEEVNESFKYFDNYEEFENTLFQLYPQVKANPEKYKKTWKNGEVSYSDGYVNWGSWYPDRPQSYSGLPPGAVNMNNKMSQSDLIYPAGSRMDEDNMESSPTNGDSSAEGQFNDLMSRYDWYYEMSDDPRKYDTGTALDQKLKSLAKTIGTDRAVELFNLKAPSDRKVTSTFFMESKDKHAKLKEILKASLKKEIINPKDIQAAKTTGDVVNIPVQDTAAQTAAKNAKINFRTYK